MTLAVVSATGRVLIYLFSPSSKTRLNESSKIVRITFRSTRGCCYRATGHVALLYKVCASTLVLCGTCLADTFGGGNRFDEKKKNPSTELNSIYASSSVFAR